MSHEKRQSYVAKWGMLLLATLVFVGLMSAPTQAADDTAAISQGFKTEGEVTPGAIVSFTDKSKTDAVKAANIDTADRIVGVVARKPLVELSGSAQQTQVVINGTVLVLVSTINGNVSYGDKITASPISGVGMKATESGLVVGTIAQDFSAAQQVTERKVRDRKGIEQTVKIGLLPVQVNVSYYRAPDDDQTILPAFLQQFVNAVAGRPVGLIRALIALALLVIGFGASAVLIYASVRSSIISIGRNPLSAPAVHRSLFEVGAMSGGILLVMVIAVYLVLAI
jgi:hypothetical protein